MRAQLLTLSISKETDSENKVVKAIAVKAIRVN